MPRRKRVSRGNKNKAAPLNPAQVIRSIIHDPLKIAHLTKIMDRQGQVVPFQPTPAQIGTTGKLLTDKWSMILKARQLGSTTVIIFMLLVQAMLRPGYRVLIVAQTWKTALKLTQMVHRFAEHMPKSLCPKHKTNQLGLTFVHGGSVEVMTAATASSRGSTYNAVLASEVAFWQHPEESARALFQALSGTDTMMILESTPDGMNGYHALWSSCDHGLAKHFLSWLDEPTYVRDTPYPVPPALQEYADKHNLPDERLWWAAHHLATKCLGSMPTFLQECAIDPVTCFLRSGDSFFEQQSEWQHAAFFAGLKTQHKPKAGHTYAIGVDSASGSNSEEADYSAAVVLDVTDKTNILIAAVLVAKETPEIWGQSVKQLALRYKGLKNTVITNIERTGGWGVPAIDACRAAKLKVFQQRKPNLTTHTTYNQNPGWDTNQITRAQMMSTMQAAVNSGRVKLTDERLQYQAARFIYLNGRPDHPAGEKDDALIAFSLALMIIVPTQREDGKKPIPFPVGHEQIIRAEMKYKMPFAQMKAQGMFDGVQADANQSGWVADDQGW
jgi:hypothetical protein